MPQLTPQSPKEKVEANTISMDSVRGSYVPHFVDVPIDIYGYFDIPIGKNSGQEFEQLKDISKWAFSKGKSIGDGLLAIKKIESKLGATRLGENRVSKVSNWIKLDNAISELKKRQEAI